MSEVTHGVGWFEIGTDDPAAAERFYGDLFGWSFADDPSGMPYRIITTPEGSANGGVFPTGGRSPNYAVFCVVVDDTEEACRRAEEAGGSVLVQPQKTSTGLVFAHLRDPGGNHFGIYSPPADQVA
ncbi:VOC family protein [Couchioplanes azureus]|uniref:VOC family protein n=1 Tax=Couchioplanes caeruleus TaxID=56438 RepID=UPI00166F87A3|nr:VOC family protein [Couchioplanes caeruleus]GGQ43725.1 glyoxalase [Couchioplanes caeruleus subsp. azureus]